ncbi:hypothetical protein COCVIDRAFT_15555 [Bipolaris victoriae FI3]|uniref:Uncharacterized protein n=1 Tax=Bipolaris victoriae (strain FI3) TaxID=930091 RepID=W7EKU5_BIPV3|nr:hypothetical protein COCVIDRAFT_15555 [Bipolaris victoriae FI3]
MAGAPGPIRRAWYQWKMQRFPWRKKWLVGFDLHGNTFWEFKDALHSLRNRRIAKYSRSTHYGDVQISPSWMQWLRHTRFDPPTIAEQQQDVARQERIKLLAAQADAKWAAKPSALDAPDKQQPVLPLQSQHPTTAPSPVNGKQDIQDTAAPRPKKAKAKEPADSPWRQAAQSQDWQPQGWTPAPAKRPS